MKLTKLLLIAAALTLSSQSFARSECVDKNGNDISNNPEAFHALIESAESCYEAKDLAEACAWGSSLDVQTAGLATVKCDADLNNQNPSRKLLKLRSAMDQACTDKYSKAQGTLNRSMEAYCHLTTVDFILGLASDLE